MGAELSAHACWRGVPPLHASPRRPGPQWIQARVSLDPKSLSLKTQTGWMQVTAMPGKERSVHKLARVQVLKSKCCGPLRWVGPAGAWCRGTRSPSCPTPAPAPPSDTGCAGARARCSLLTLPLRSLTNFLLPPSLSVVLLSRPLKRKREETLCIFTSSPFPSSKTHHT